MKLRTTVLEVATIFLFAVHADAQIAERKVADAKTGEVRVLPTAAIGKPIVVEYGSARGNLKDEILKGVNGRNWDKVQ